MRVNIDNMQALVFPVHPMNYSRLSITARVSL